MGGQAPSPQTTTVQPPPSRQQSDHHPLARSTSDTPQPTILPPRSYHALRSHHHHLPPLPYHPASTAADTRQPLRGTAITPHTASGTHLGSSAPANDVCTPSHHATILPPRSRHALRSHHHNILRPDYHDAGHRQPPGRGGVALLHPTTCADRQVTQNPLVFDGAML